MVSTRPPTPPRSQDGDRDTDLKHNLMHQEGSDKQGPTDSHVISQIQQDEKGLVQKVGNTKDISDIGWGQSPEVQEQIVAGLSNEDLWMLIRRFDKQLYYVKSVPYAPMQRLDLNRAEDEDFSPDKLRATLERFYTTVVMGVVSAANHIARLRSWREHQRTSAFCTVYFVAWILDLLAPTFYAVLIALVVHPPSRTSLFPPAPIALVDTATGGTKQPKAGHLGSDDSVTGAPERFKGEAAEKEANNIVAGVASLAVGSVAGKHDQGTEDAPEDSPETAEIEQHTVDPMEAVSKTADARTAAHGETPAEHDKTKQPIKQTVIETANQSMRALSDITDTYERFGNALSPTRPFSLFTPYLRLAGVLACAFTASLLTSSYAFVKISTFLFGFGFFGDPVLIRIVEFLDRRYSHWKQLLELQNSILRGIPTNAQLTLTLLRIGEANVAPLPPPPNSEEKTPSKPASVHNDAPALNDAEKETKQAATPDPHEYPTDETQSTTSLKSKKTGFVPRVVSFFRGTTATGVVSKFAVDRVRAAAGSRHARNRVGILHSKGKEANPSGPVEFAARYKGKRGAAVIDTTKNPPLLYFTTEPAPNLEDLALENQKSGSVLFVMPVTDIREMRKTGGLGWKGKLVVGWAVGNKEVTDGLFIVGKQPEKRHQLTAMTMRNQLFDRLIAIDGQVWESR